ncbi:MAG: hypothetical protein JW839_18675 [Candidatus Lokiarchaeota archaeon]|nr:hypothetical protein [Candidatus Lokiarchaeota archaeon]
MLQIIGMDIDLLTILGWIPAVFGTLMSVRNWLAMRRGADLVPNRILNYGHISGGEVHSFFMPLIVHNEGAKPGVITDIQIAFTDGETTTSLNVCWKVKLKGLGSKVLEMSYESFCNEGYEVEQPLYPITVPAGESASVMLECAIDEGKAFPVDKEVNCIIRVEYGHNRHGETSFPFKMTASQYGMEYIRWYKPIE